MIITIGIIVMLMLAMAFVLFFYFSQKKFQAQKTEAQKQELKHQEQLLFGSIQAQEKERQRLARELHDEVGSKLNVINLGLHRLKKMAAEKPALGETVEELFGVVGTTIDTARRISHDLLPPTLENFGLAAALEELCENHRQAADVEVGFELRKNERTISDLDISLHLFRAVQELMSNSFKHAGASRIEVELWLGQNNIRLIFRDNGKGFRPDDPACQKGLGMQNIESRMRMAGAEYRLESEPGNGVFVEMKVG